jgi:large subunit ribosomal protein L33
MAAKKNRNNKVLMIPEGEKRDAASFHFVHAKTLNQLRNAKKLRMRKYHPKLRQHVWFIEAKMPPHSK